MFNWILHHLLPCPFKYLTGIDCPGCGFQRSVIELFQGNLKKSFLLYPPAIPILMLLIYYLLALILKSKQQKSIPLKPLLIIVALIIMFSYTIKMLGYANVI
ncbi:DUF2752 domain-containing protein [Mucilaginibacter puniceus]